MPLDLDTVSTLMSSDVEGFSALFGTEDLITDWTCKPVR